jgi:peptide/nickel transport system permease protein
MATSIRPDTQTSEVIAAGPFEVIRGLFASTRANPSLAVGGAIMLFMLTAAVAAPLLTNQDPRAIDVANRLLTRDAAHLLGTDQLGRDILARILYGARISLMIGFFCALLTSVFGVAIGMVSASSRLSDAIVMRIMDGVMSVPAILLAIALMAIAGGSAGTVIAAVTFVETPRCARLIRGLMLSLRERPYVEAAIAGGSGRIQLMVRHILPSLWAPLVVQATFNWAGAMLIEAALSFIGAGLPPAVPTWGNMIAEAKTLWQIMPGLIFMPAAALSLTILGVNLVGEGLRQTFDMKRGH